MMKAKGARNQEGDGGNRARALNVTIIQKKPADKAKGKRKGEEKGGVLGVDEIVYL